MVDAIAAGLEALIVARRAEREEREEWQRQCKERESLQALAKQRGEREQRRLDFLQRLVGQGEEIAKLEAWLETARPVAVEESDGEFRRLISWAEARLSTLRARAQPHQIALAIRDKKLFPEPDDLAGPDVPDVPRW